MTTALVLLAGMAAFQGQILQLTVPDEAGLDSVNAQWNQRSIPFVKHDDHWLTVIGIDLDAVPGEHEARISLKYVDGLTRTQIEYIDVQNESFPTTELTVEPRYVELNANDQARAANESLELGAIYTTLTGERYWSDEFQVPIPGSVGGRNFGHRRIFNGQARAPHSGADIRASTGTPILASNRGRVVLAKELFFSGNAVFLDHGLGVYSTYLHLSEIQVEPGKMVERGEIIGLAGATGRVTGPHLHWGVRVLDARVDPFTLLELGTN